MSIIEVDSSNAVGIIKGEDICLELECPAGQIYTSHRILRICGGFSLLLELMYGYK